MNLASAKMSAADGKRSPLDYGQRRREMAAGIRLRAETLRRRYKFAEQPEDILSGIGENAEPAVLEAAVLEELEGVEKEWAQLADTATSLEGSDNRRKDELSDAAEMVRENHRHATAFLEVMRQHRAGDDWATDTEKIMAMALESRRDKLERIMSEQKHTRLILEDGAHEAECFDVPSSLPLKSFFNDYAEKRGVSLRTLRFSLNGKALFLSSAGKRSPDELHMKDQDVITALDTRSSAPQEASDASCQNRQDRRKSAGAAANAGKRKTAKSKKKRIHREEPAATLEDDRRRHSRQLSKVHEEVQPRLKDIRVGLQALYLERQLPKQRRRSPRKTASPGDGLGVLPHFASGPKAGKSHFLVRIGEESHLHSSSKLLPQRHSCDVSVLDLHGFTRDAALAKLEESLEAWVNMALLGSYPFVMPAVIVCGKGNQILSEAVQKWIKSTKHICLAPKNTMP